MSNEIIRLQNLLTKLNNLFSLQEYPTTSDKIIDVNDGKSKSKSNLYFQVTIDKTTDFYERLEERMAIAYDDPSSYAIVIPSKSHITLLAITINYYHHKTKNESFENIYHKKCLEIEKLLKRQIMSLPFKQTTGDYDLFPYDVPRFLVKKMELIDKYKYTRMINQVKEILQQGLIKSEWKKNITINTGDKQSKGDGLFVNDQLLYFISEYYLTGEQWKPHISVYKSEQR